MARALVTGGAGFIGSHVAERFLEDGYEVVVVDDLSSGDRQNLPPSVGFEELDIRDERRLDEVVRAFGPDVVCHLAAQSSVTVSVRRPAHDLHVNVGGTLNVCESARRVGAGVVFASTGGALYGNDAPLPTAESWPPQPLAPYGASKAAGEAYVATWGRAHGVPNAVLRLGNVYGPRQNPHGEAGVVAIFSEKFLRGDRPLVYGHGRPTRDYVYVTDVARAFALVAQHRISGTYNVGTGRPTSVGTLLESLQRVAETSLQPELTALRPGELEQSALDSARLRDACGWRPTVTLEDGLARAFQTYAEAVR